MNRAGLAMGVAAVAAIGGYGVAGHPMLEDTPAPPRASNPASGPAIQAAQKKLLKNNGDLGAWLGLADAFVQNGATGRGVDAMQVALGAYPRSPDLWVGLGNALVIHAEGQVTPAARLAFGRAAALDPTHPGPRYFLGLAYLQAGKPADAVEAWEALRAQSPPGSPWLADLYERIAAARMMAKLPPR